MIDIPEDEVCLAGVRGPLKLEDALFVGRKSNRIAPLQVLRADRVMGSEHIQSAARHAHRALAEGRQQADRLEVEFLRYAAGKRQIKHALGFLGLPDPAPAAVVVALGPRRVDALRHFVDALGLREDDSLIDPDPAAIEHFATSAALAATPKERHLDLVLESVAAVDTLK